MSCNYAEGLSPYHDKGQLGLEEKFDSKSVVTAKVSLLTKWICEAKHVVIHTGAGISTSAGIPDFRGPKGVWTLEAKGKKPDLSKDFNEAIPTVTHMAIMKLVEKGHVKHVVSQNIDGLHLRSNLQRKFLSELHGNMFTEQCNSCNRQFVRSTPVPSVGQKLLNKPCPTLKANGRPCRGRLHDTILDWEHNLPENDLGMADYHSCLADLSICLGTTMQIVPSGNLPLYTKKHGGKLVIINLQPTKHNRKADLLIHAYVDEVMTMLMKNLNIKIPKYSPKNDPTRTLASLQDKFIEWTISDYALKKMKKIYEEKCGTKEARKRLEMIDDDIPLSIKTFKRKAKEDDDSDLEVLDVIVKPKKSRESSKRGSKKNSPPVYNTTITIKKVVQPPKKTKYEGTEKITIKKKVTPTKTKYEIVTKPKKVPKCEIVYNTESDLCNDLDMICESDDDEMTNNFTYNFKRYLYDDVKKEEVKEEDVCKDTTNVLEVKSEVKNEVKVEDLENETKVDQEKGTEINEESEVGKDKIEDIAEKEHPNREETEKTGEEKEGNRQESVEIIEKGPENVTCELDTSSENNNERENVNPLAEDVEKTLPGTTQECGSELEKQENNEKKEGEIPEEKDNTNKTTNEISQIEENIHMEVDSDPGQSQPNTNKVVNEKELDELIGEDRKDKQEEGESKETSDKDKEKGNAKAENVYQNIESELSSLSNSNLESQIDQIVNPSEASQFDNSLTMSGENYEFYSNDYNSSNNPPDLDYVDNNYYNNF